MKLLLVVYDLQAIKMEIMMIKKGIRQLAVGVRLKFNAMECGVATAIAILVKEEEEKEEKEEVS